MLKLFMGIFMVSGCTPKYQIGDTIYFTGTYGTCSGAIKEISPWPYKYSLLAKCTGVTFSVDVINIPESYISGKK